mgnify:CR=1 FL=1
MIEYENLKILNKSFVDEFRKSFDIFLDSGHYILGTSVKKFEQEFAEYTGFKHCVGVSSGLDALRLSLEVYKFPKGSEVLVPSNTYIATILAIIHAGLIPVLVEPDIETYNIDDKDQIEKAITNKTVAIMPVHLYGRPCDNKVISYISNKYNLKIIEDCAQSHGSETGSNICCYSFYPTKNLGCLGDGGAIVLNDDVLFDDLIKARNYGRTGRYENVSIGWNNRLDEIQAGFLSVKLPFLDKINAHKKNLAKIYDGNLSDNVVKPKFHEKHVYHIYNIRTPFRDKLKQFLSENCVFTEIHYPIPPHQQEALKGYFENEYLISTEIHSTTLSLPISYGHSEEDILKVCSLINDFFLENPY